MTVNHLQKNQTSYDRQLSTYIEDYSILKEPIEISFRKLVSQLSQTDRATHLLHPYPAKLLMHIPYFFLNNSIISKPGDVGLDPFCGSGTVLLESILAGRNCWGVDANPLAQLISKVKTTMFNIDKLHDYLPLIKSTCLENETPIIPAVVNINHWFSNKAQQQLGRLLYSIHQVDEIIYKEFFLICFSVCVRKVSNADPRISVPVKLKPGKYKNNLSLQAKVNTLLEELTDIDVYKRFFEIVELNTKRIKNFLPLSTGNATAQIIGDDARQLTASLNSKNSLPTESIDFIITSPPYAGAQKYIRASSLNLCWTQLSKPEELKVLTNNSIGREYYHKHLYANFKPTGIKSADLVLKEIYEEYPLRAYIAGNYLLEMTQAFSEIYRVLKKGKSFVLVAANNQVCGRNFATQIYLSELAQNLGFKVELELIDDINSYGLMTKRNKTASVITREWVTVFKKV